MKKSWCGLARSAVVTLCVSACWIAPIAAVNASTKAPAKQTKAKAKPISRDQLRACMDQQDRIDGLRAKVLQEQASLDQQRAEVARMDAELSRKRNAPPEVAAVVQRNLHVTVPALLIPIIMCLVPIRDPQRRHVLT